MEARTVLLTVIFGLAMLFVVATTISRERVATGSLGREARRADRSPLSDASRPDPDAEARARFVAAKAGLEPAGVSPVRAVGPLIRFEAPGDPETLGVTRRQFFNRSILTTQSLVLGSFGMAVIAFLWPARGGGFGGKVRAGKVDDILDQIREKREPFYVPEARGYIVPYPKAALSKAKNVYAEAILPGMEAGVVALFQKCPHLGCRVPWCTSSQWFECPCHGSKYNRVGEKKGGPAPRGMDRFPVDVGGGVLTINTAIVVQGPSIGTNTTGQEAEGAQLRVTVRRQWARRGGMARSRRKPSTRRKTHDALLKAEARARRHEHGGVARRRIGWAIGSAGILLFVVGYITSVASVELLPFDRHHVVLQLGGGVLATAGVRWGDPLTGRGQRDICPCPPPGARFRPLHSAAQLTRVRVISGESARFPGERGRDLFLHTVRCP